MKNKMTRNVILMAVVTVIMAVALSLYIQNTGTVPAADNAASLTEEECRQIVASGSPTGRKSRRK